MNDFIEIIEMAKMQQASLVQNNMLIPVGDHIIQGDLLLTDDLAIIFSYYLNDKSKIKDLISYTESLPYIIKLDLMYYLGKDKSNWNKLMKIKSFRKFVDGFSKIVANI